MVTLGAGSLLVILVQRFWWKRFIKIELLLYPVVSENYSRL